MGTSNQGSFVKGDPRINRSGRPKNAEKELLRQALINEGKKRGIDFWDKVAQAAYDDKGLMAVVAKKFVPDMSTTEHSGEINVTEMPTVQVGGKDLELNIGSDPASADDTGHPSQVDAVPDGNQQL